MLIKSVICLLNKHTFSGYENTPVVFLIKCVDFICVLLAKISNMSLQHGQYPDVLKYNNITPFKKIKGVNSASSPTEGFRFSQ